jgi:hypothetical protein
MQEGYRKTSQVLKESNCQPRLLYSAKLSFLIEGENKTSHNKEKQKEFTTTKWALQKILKGILHIEEENKDRKTQERINYFEQADH